MYQETNYTIKTGNQSFVESRQVPGKNSGLSSLKIETLEVLHLSDPGLKETVKLDHYEFVWIKSGRLSLIADLREYQLKENMVYYLRPGQLRAFKNISTEAKGYLISITPEFIAISDSRNELATFLGYTSEPDHGVMDITESLKCEMEDVILKLSREIALGTSKTSGILQAYFRILTIYIGKITVIENTTTNKTREAEIVEAFLSLLRKHYISKKMVSEYAKDLFVSPNYLNRVVKKISGFPASYHIQQYLVLEAKRQAVISGSSMKEVAYYLGFTDYAHFSKFFKNNSGINFSNFKKDYAS